MRLVSLSVTTSSASRRVYGARAHTAPPRPRARVGRRLRASSSAAVAFMQPPERWRTTRNIATFRLLPTGRPFAWRSESGPPGMRISLVVLVLALAGLLAVDLEPSAAPRKAEAAPPRKATTPAPRIVEVAFVRNGRLTRVERVVPEKVAPEVHALRELVRARLASSAAGDPNCDSRGRTRPLGSSGRRAVAREPLPVDVRSGSAADEADPSPADSCHPHAPRPAGVRGRRDRGRLVTTLRLGMRPDDWRAEIGENDYPPRARSSVASGRSGTSSARTSRGRSTT